MSLVSLPYGKEQITANISDNRLSGIMYSNATRYSSGKTEAKIVKDALLKPIGSPPLRELARGKKHVVIISDNHPCPVPDRLILPALVREIRSGNPQADITILLESGSPPQLSKSILKQKFGKAISEDPCLHFAVHADNNYDEMVFLGCLPSGTELKVNRLAVEADLLIGKSFVEPDYICGYTGGAGCILPGISSRRTVITSRSSQIIDNKYTRAGILDNNPVYQDMTDAAQKVGLAFIINAVLNRDREIIEASAGNFLCAHKKCCEGFEDFFRVSPIPSDIIITTAGGHPFDQTICQSIRGLIPAEATCKQGGVIILAASCSKGCGHQFVYETFASENSKERIMLRFLAATANETIQEQWYAQILCRILIQFKVIMVTDAPEYMVRAMHMDYAPDLERAIEMADDYLGRKYHRITVIPDGRAIIVPKKYE